MRLQLGVIFAAVLSVFACGPLEQEPDQLGTIEDELGEDLEAPLALEEPLSPEELQDALAEAEPAPEPEDDLTDAASDVDVPEEATAAALAAEPELAEAALAVVAPPRFQTVFNDPFGTTGARMAVENALVRLIDLAAPGSEIRGSWYHFARGRVGAALLRAGQQRKVKIWLALDREALNAEAKKALGPISTVLCDKRNDSVGGRRGEACLGSHINHNKFATFSALTDGSKNVVWQSSANITGFSMHQNAVIVRGNTALYNTYVDYFADLRGNPRTPKLGYNRTFDAKSGVRVYFSPNSKTDYILGALGNVHCPKSGAKGAVRVAMSFFTGDRGIQIARKLGSLRKDGCGVEVLIGDDKDHDRVSTGVRKALDKYNVPTRNYAMSAGHAGIHSKYMLIDAPYGAGKTRAQIVFTGSHNYQPTALRNNDETLMRVVDKGVYDAFLKDYARIRTHTR